MNPLRDMEIIQTELRLKDIEWVEKQIEALKRTGRSLGNNSLADKAKKEEIVGRISFHRRPLSLIQIQGDRREGVEDAHRGQQGRPKGGMEQQRGESRPISFSLMKKSHRSINPALRGGSNAPISNEMTFYPDSLCHRLRSC